MNSDHREFGVDRFQIVCTGRGHHPERVLGDILRDASGRLNDHWVHGGKQEFPRPRRSSPNRWIVRDEELPEPWRFVCACRVDFQLSNPKLFALVDHMIAEKRPSFDVSHAR